MPVWPKGRSKVNKSHITVNKSQNTKKLAKQAITVDKR